MIDKYKGVKSFWKAHDQSTRLSYLREWKIFLLKGMHLMAATVDWEDLTDFEQETIFKAHRKAVKTNH